MSALRILKPYFMINVEAAAIARKFEHLAVTSISNVTLSLLRNSCRSVAGYRTK
jgi:hypothetical protein